MVWATKEDIKKLVPNEATVDKLLAKPLADQDYLPHTYLLMERTSTHPYRDKYKNTSLEWRCPRCGRMRKVRVVRTSWERLPPMCSGVGTYLLKKGKPITKRDEAHERLICVHLDQLDRAVPFAEQLPMGS